LKTEKPAGGCVPDDFKTLSHGCSIMVLACAAYPFSLLTFCYGRLYKNVQFRRAWAFFESLNIGVSVLIIVCNLFHEPFRQFQAFIGVAVQMAFLYRGPK